MDNKELKENIVNIIKAYSNLTTGWGETVRDFILNEDDFEDVAEEIVNLLPIHDVSNLLTKYIGTVIESEGCDYIPQKGMQKYDKIKITDEEIDILTERAKLFSDC